MSAVSKACARRRVLSWPVFGLTLGALIAGSGAAQAAGPVLPTGGRVAAGQAVIGVPAGGVLTIKQSSAKAILDWSGFSIGAGGKVAFNNGSGATLNRVTGANVSSLDGLLTGTGSVYLINPNGVIVGKSGVVKVGGTFVASTLDTSDAGFLAGGPLSFAGSSTASVVNLGKVGALGGDVALIAAEVSNAGAISAPQGSAGLIAGHSVLMLRDGSLDQGRFSVLLGGAGTRVTNSGLISAADAELRAEGGNVYALAGDTSGVIRATGVKRGGGKVWLVAQGGELDLAGAIDARGAGGTAGSVETSGGTVKIGSARIDAHGGSWLVDPDDLTIDATAANTIDTALNAGTSVTEQTTANGYSGAGVASTSGKGDITVAAPISWNTGAELTLSAYRNIDINAQVTASGGGALTLVIDNSGAGNGGTLLFNGGSVQFTGVSGGQPTGSLAIGVGTGAPTDYTLVADLQTLSNDIAANNSGFFALAVPVDGGNKGVGYVTSPLTSTVATPFAGILNGMNNSVDGLAISDPLSTNVGLFGQIGAAGSVENINITGTVTSTYGGTTFVGGLAGTNQGNLSHVSSGASVISPEGYAGSLIGYNSGAIMVAHGTGSVSGVEAGGLTGWNSGSIANAFATGQVTGVGYADAGGLVGYNISTISQSYATGGVTDSNNAGGLVGFNDYVIISSYSTSAVNSGDAAGGLAGVNMGRIGHSYASGPVTGYVTGGLVGLNINSGTSTASFFDTQTTKQTTDAAGATGLTTAQFTDASSPISGIGLSTTPGGSGFVIIDTDGTLNGSNGATRPILLSEYSTTVTNAHQLQLMALNLNASYSLASDIDASGTTNPSDIWSPAGFAPIGATQNISFSGALDGQGHDITGLSIDRPETDYVGLVGVLRGQVSGVRLLNTQVNGEDFVGALIGLNYGTAFNVAASGMVVGRDYVGGLIGDSYTTVNNASSMASVSGSTQVGGLLGVTLAATTDSYAGGNVTGNEAGGLVGANYGVIQNAYATGAVSGPGYSGGIAGINQTLGGMPTATVETSYASGAVTGSGGVGGLVGWNAGGNVTGSYWDVATTRQTTAVGLGAGSGSMTNLVGTGGSKGFSSYAQSTYANLDFSASGSWVIFDGSTRPILKSEYSTTVTNAHQLQLMALNLSATYTLAANVDASGTSNPSDVWGPGGFVPVGQASTPFSGVLNGGGHTVSGLSIAEPGATDVGLFGAQSGTIQNVIVSGAVTGGTAVGALVGYNTGTVSGASGKGTVSGSSQVGGLLGYTSGAVSGSYGKAAVSSPSSAGSQMGGLAGFNSGQLSADYATGKVTGNTQLGGLVGLNAGPGTLTGDYATGAVNGASGKTAAGSGSAVGGLVGQDSGEILSSYATGAVTGYSRVGGLAGYTDGAQVLSSYATGAVSGASGQNTPGGSGAMVGGLIGESSQGMAIDGSYATGAVSGVSQVGGLIGSHDGSGVLERSYATGSVTGTSQVGGLVGYNNNEIVNSYATGAVSGSSGKGALVGVNDQFGSAIDSYATGNAAFGLVGVNKGSGMGELSQDYFDIGSTGATMGVGSGPAAGVSAIGGSTGLDPHQASSYAGFDFANTWTIQAGASRPYLLAVPQSPPPT